MIKVYFESNGYKELVAIFADSELYLECYDKLHRLAEAEGYRITEIAEEQDIECLFEE